jgi:hypothetical protein
MADALLVSDQPMAGRIWIRPSSKSERSVFQV